NRGSRQVDCTAEVLCRAAVELERGAGGNAAVAEHDDSLGRSRPRRSEIDGGVSVDGCGRPGAFVLFCKDECDAGPIEGGSAVQGQAASIQIIDTGIERNGGAGVDS